eukprot:TRINITY_DN2031_c0_g1_i3.p1 TRINITY_DN2031_c0_g1~~TRINITY_DN2031_c0_g1_i3.p1  ORF type:complete len:109 (+),score=23.06 TRINITY_DN2031_c0_g1_i3:28-327(+)
MCNTHSDIHIYRTDLKNALPPNEQVFADKGYIGEDSCVTPHKKKKKQNKLSLTQEDWNEWIGKHRAIVENLNAELKKWTIFLYHREGNLNALRDYIILI